ncbi:MAG: protein kinase [Lachnospiraceae bacterium]|nr:protein kinase [Lachnospiraceae bacterium]
MSKMPEAAERGEPPMPEKSGAEAIVLSILRTLPGDWRIQKFLYQGTMSSTWLLCSQRVRWKLVLKLAAPKEQAGWALRREISFLRQLRGEGIPFLYHDGADSEIPWYSMIFYEGETLREALWRQQTLTEKETAYIGRRLCRILSVLHERTRPVIYGDLKPENVLLTKDGGVYLLDYGNAWYPGEDQGRIGFRGTVGYAPPECWHLEQAGTGVDIFALGVLLHEMLEGGRPEEHFGEYQLQNSAYKKRWQALIDACTALNAKKRIVDVRKADQLLYIISTM